jgi:catechol 1,2-dioxygenase
VFKITQQLLTPFQVPDDGPAGHLLKMMDRHPFRPAHIHLVVRHEGYKHLTTQIFDKDCKYLADDSVFAVKDELSVTFELLEGDPEAKLELKYDITLAPRI